MLRSPRPGLHVLFCCAVLAAASSAQDTSAAPKHLLRLVPEAGGKAWYRQESTMKQTMAMGARKLENDMLSTLLVSSQVTGVDGGKATIERAFVRATAKATGFMKVDFDSDDPDSHAGPFASLAEVIGQSATLQVDDRARIVDVKLSKDFPEAAFDALGVDIAGMFAQGAPALPDLPVGIGETWATEQVMKSGRMGDAKIKITNKLAAVEGREARIEQTMVFEMDTSKLPGVTVTTEEAAGTTTVDLATGMPVRSDMHIVTHIKGGGQGPGMDMLMDMKVHVERVPEPAKAAPKDAAGAGAKDGGK